MAKELLTMRLLNDSPEELVMVWAAVVLVKLTVPVPLEKPAAPALFNQLPLRVIPPVVALKIVFAPIVKLPLTRIEVDVIDLVEDPSVDKL